MSLEMDLLPVERGENRSGDCIALRFGNLEEGEEKQFVMLVDGGYSNTKEKLKELLSRYYKCKRRDGRIEIDLMILTHPDLDHIEGMVDVLKDDVFSVRGIIAAIPSEEMTEKFFKDGRITSNSLEKRLEDSFKKLAELKELSGERLCSNIFADNGRDTIDVGVMKITFLSPSNSFYRKCIANSDKSPSKGLYVEQMKYPAYYGQQKEKSEKYVRGAIEWNDKEGTSPINESSYVMLFEYEGHRILFCGDAGKEALENAISRASEKGIELRNLDIIIIPHHGSRKNVSPEIMDQLGSKGTRCYISCCRGDEGHHPSKRLINMLIEKGFAVYTTQGRTLHKGWDAPDRHWQKAQPLSIQAEMDSL